MKKIILIALVMLMTTTHSQQNDTATKQKVDILDFFETLINPNPKHPDNKRDPSWPDHLTIEPLEILDEKSLNEKIQGIWKTYYHCNGAPVLHTDVMFDGKKNGYLNSVFDGKHLTRLEIDNPLTGVKKIEHDKVGYTTELQNFGFIIKYEKKFKPEFMYFAKIKYRNQTRLVMIRDEVPRAGLCPNGKFIQAFEIKLTDHLM